MPKKKKKKKICPAPYPWSLGVGPSLEIGSLQMDLTGFPGGPVVKNPPANAGDTGSIPGSGRSPGEGHGNPVQCSCLEAPMDRRASRATVRVDTRDGQKTERLSSRWNEGKDLEVRLSWI